MFMLGFNLLIFKNRLIVYCIVIEDEFRRVRKSFLVFMHIFLCVFVHKREEGGIEVFTKCENVILDSTGIIKTIFTERR